MQPSAGDGTDPAAPVRSRRGAGPWLHVSIALVLFLGAVLRLFPDWFEVPAVAYDAAEYHELAKELNRTGQYSGPFREPLLPFLLAQSYRWLGDDHLLQLRLLGALSWLGMIGAWLLLRCVLPRDTDWLLVAVLLLLAIDGDQLASTRELSTAPLHATALVALALLLVHATRRDALWPWAASGLVLGLLGLSRGAWLLLGIPAAVMALRCAPRRHWAAAALLLSATAFVVLPWMIRNERQHGFFGLAASAGVHLFTRTYHLKPDGGAGLEVRMRAAQHRAALAGLEGDRLSEAVKWRVLADMLAAGTPLPEAERGFRAVAIENASSRPGRYAIESLFLLTRLIGSYDFTWTSDQLATSMRQPISDQLEHRDWGGVAQKLAFRILWPALAALCLLAGSALGRRHDRRETALLCWLATAALLLFAIGAPSTGVRRYRSELDGLMLPAIAAGACLLRRPAAA